MADPTLPNELLAGLQDIRLPESAPGGLIAELAAAVGVGLLISSVLSFLIPILTRKETQNRAPSLDEKLDAARQLPEAERSVSLLHMLREQDKDAVDALQKRLYGQAEFPSSQELEQQLRQIENTHA